MPSTIDDVIDGVSTSMAVKVPCRVATTGPITLSGEQTIDGVAVVTGNRVLVKDQADDTENGIYVASTTAWSRAKDFDGNRDVTEGTLVKVNNGTVGQGFWYVSTTGTITIGTSSIEFAQASSTLAVVSAFWQVVLQLSTAALSRAALSVYSISESVAAFVGLSGDQTIAGVKTFSSKPVLPATTPTGNEAASATFVASQVSVLPQGRLTLTTAVPVTTADVTAGTTIYYTPYQGNKVPIYDGSTLVATAFTELSQAISDATKSPAAVAADKVYDLFVWNDSGTLRCTRGPAWTNDTTRGYTLTMTNGVLLNTSTITNGPAALRGTYVGTIRSDSSSQINDSAAKRHVWNTYNRVTRSLQNALETANSWSYSTGTIRQANANAANQLDYVCGLAEDAVSAVVSCIWEDSGSAGTAAGLVFIGVDSTTTNSAQQMAAPVNAGANIRAVSTATYRGIPGIGRHYLAWLERGNTSATTTWYGDASNAAIYQSGISGTMRS